MLLIAVLIHRRPYLFAQTDEIFQPRAQRVLLSLTVASRLAFILQPRPLCCQFPQANLEAGGDVLIGARAEAKDAVGLLSFYLGKLSLDAGHIRLNLLILDQHGEIRLQERATSPDTRRTQWGVAHRLPALTR